MTSELAEYRLVEMWRDLISREDILVTVNGEPLRIIYPGRLNDDRGADFRDAVIMAGDNIQRGSIELHVKSSDWETHGHHLDPAYNSVILHVVFREDSPLTVRRADGETVTTLSICRYLEKRLQYAEYSLPCCRIAARQPEKVSKFLEAMGEVRFREKADRFRNDLNTIDAGQVLYRGIMGALGYSKNKIPCLKLAECVPLSQLEALMSKKYSAEESLILQQAVLLGTASLLPSLRGLTGENSDGYVDILEKYWSINCHGGVLPWSSWNLFKVRPNNSPLRRLAALTYLVQRYRGTGLLASITHLVAVTLVEYPHRLAEALLVSTDGYWATHYDFNKACLRLSRSLLGSDRAADIVINIILPFICALEEGYLSEKALAIYRVYPALPSNSVEKHLQQQLSLKENAVNFACRQQGLIHIYKTLCTQGKCNECGLS